MPCTLAQEPAPISNINSTAGRTLAVALTAVALCSSALAGRPLQTEDAGVLERGTCEVEGATERLSAPGTPRARDTGLQWACGTGFDSQLSLGLSRATSAGVRDQGLRLGGKTEVWNAGKDGAAITIAWGASAGKAPEASWKKDSVEAVAVATVPAAGLAWHLNLGHERDLQAKVSTTVWGLAAEHPGFGAWAPMAEIVGNDREAPWWNLGLRWTLSEERAFLDLSWGRQIRPGRPTLLTAGFKFVF